MKNKYIGELSAIIVEVTRDSDGSKFYSIRGQSFYQNELNKGMDISEAVASRFHGDRFVAQIPFDDDVRQLRIADNDIGNAAIEGHHDKEAWKRFDYWRDVILKKYKLLKEK